MHRYLLASLLICTILNGADETIREKAMKHYHRAEYSTAIPLFEQIIAQKKHPQQDFLHLAHCQAAVALSTQNPKLLYCTLRTIVAFDQDVKPYNSKNKKLVAIANGDFGTTIFCAYYLKRINEKLVKQNKPQIPLHLKGNQQKLTLLMKQAQVSDNITFGELDTANKIVLPSLAWLLDNEKHLFEPHEPYLQVNEALAYWKERVDQTKHNVAIAWSPAVVERSLPVRELLTAIFTDPQAHVYVLQGPPNNLIRKSEFDLLSDDAKKKRAFDWLPDHLYELWQSRITTVEENHGPFVDSAALLQLMRYVGCGTALLHIAASVENGKATVILPKLDDNKSNFYWRMGEPNQEALQGEGQQVPGHHEHIRLFECEPTKQEFMRILQHVRATDAAQK